jgi:ABC-type Na+ efflux pump permease subunit
MKKFWLLLTKEIKEMLTPELWIPFFAVMVVFLVIGNVAGKQISEQSKTKENVIVYDADQTNL